MMTIFKKTEARARNHRRGFGWFALVASVLMLLTACGSVDPQVYAGRKPELDLKRYFSGQVDGWGTFSDRSGQVQRSFVVSIRCTWDGDNGILDEDFIWSDGEKQKRVWRIRQVGPGRYVGTADDVVGEAQGIAVGNALNWRYQLAVPVGGSTYHFDFDDWMFQIDDKVVLNKAVMSKFGIKLGEVYVSFLKR